MCDKCIHKPVCDKFTATGGRVGECEHFKEEQLEQTQDGVTVTMTREQAETIHHWLQYGVDYHKCKKVEMEYCKDEKMRQELVAQHETALTKTYDALEVIAATLGITVF